VLDFALRLQSLDTPVAALTAVRPGLNGGLRAAG